MLVRTDFLGTCVTFTLPNLINFLLGAVRM
jgi:hypothetical protein